MRPEMLKTRFYTAEHDIDRKLSWFGVTRDELIEVARQTLASRSDEVEIDVRSMPGQLSYLYGTRYLRMLFLKKGWRIDRAENVESVVSDKLSSKIVFQNVDQACSLFHSPLAISAKGPAANRMISIAQGRLFSPSEAPEVVRPEVLSKLNSTVWCFCMSFDGDNVNVELSLPSHLNGNNFSSFLERIFIVSGGEWGGSIVRESDEFVEVLPTITRL